jgi:outer membrane receptor protein involved in Fe transport
MSGLNAVGGSINYVNKQPTSGPIRNEVDTGVDSFGSPRTHFGSGGNTGVQGLDYRFDAVGSKLNSFIDGDFRDLAGLAAQLNYRVSSDFAALLQSLAMAGRTRRFGASCRQRFLFPDDATTLLAYTTADVYTFVDIPGRDLLRPEIENLRLGFRVRNLTNVVYAQWADTTYPEQALLGAPCTYEVTASARW